MRPDLSIVTRSTASNAATSCYDRRARNREALQTMAGRMRKVLTALAVAATFAAYSAPAAADGTRRAWRTSGYAIGAISRNVITPYYVGYYGSHYSYYAPVSDGGYRVWVC